MSPYVSATVLLPEDRVEEFFATYANWLAGSPTLGDHGIGDEVELRDWTGSHEDHEAAKVIWRRLSPRAKALFARLSHSPGRRHSAAELADELEIPNGFYGVAGVLAWPGRHAAAAGYHLPVQWMPGELGEGASYWMSEAAAACFLPHVESEEL